ncbi:uncharacterized protein LOC141659914 [Apium graveolens]|uniref:uncharacterized protein LOC141659914 n=1 Tax=Apium graveolens TaxID=4045 RepID=UPI003D7B12D1
MDLKEPCICKEFGSTLAGTSVQWFVGLPNERIRTFAELVDAFNQQIASSRCFEKTTIDLYKVYQKYREPLRDYLTRFNWEKVTITNCDTPTAIEAFRRGRVADWRKDPGLPPTFDNYGFNVTLTVLVKEFEKLGNAVRWPPKTSKPRSNPDSKLWCEFHGDYGHRAKDCVALRKEIDVLVKKGYLTEYMSTHTSNNVRDNTTPYKLPPPPPHHKVINYIAGGSEICGATYSQAKRVTRGIGTRVQGQKCLQVAHTYYNLMSQTWNT